MIDLDEQSAEEIKLKSSDFIQDDLILLCHDLIEQVPPVRASQQRLRSYILLRVGEEVLEQEIGIDLMMRRFKAKEVVDGVYLNVIQLEITLLNNELDE